MPEIIERTLGWDRDQVVRGQSPGAKDIAIAFRIMGISGSARGLSVILQTDLPWWEARALGMT